MAQELVKTVLKAKLGFIEERKNLVHAMVEHEYLKSTSKAREVLETKVQDQDELKDINLKMDTVLGCFIQLEVKIKDILSSTMTEGTDRVVTQASPVAEVSPSACDFESRTSGQNIRSRTLPESAPTLCDNEESHDEIVNKDNEDMGIQLREGKTLSSQVLDKKGQRLAPLEKLSQQTLSIMLEEINPEKIFEDNSRKTKLEYTEIDYFHKEFQKTQEQNMATIKELAYKLGKVEEEMKKMKEEEQEKLSKIDSMQKDVESFKNDQRDKQILDKIQGLEKHMETLTSQCDFLQDQVGKTEELAHKISKELEETKSQLDDSKKKADNMSTRMDKLDHPRVGFTAFYSYKMPALKQGTITDFTTVLCNEGEGFIPATGEFICPADGLYGIFANLRQLRDGEVLLLVKSQSSDKPKEVCRLKTDMANTSSCGLGVAMLQTGDSVFVHLSLKNGNPGLTHYSSFSCFRIA